MNRMAQFGSFVDYALRDSCVPPCLGALITECLTAEVDARPSMADIVFSLEQLLWER